MKEQRSELFQLERSLGIKIERMHADDNASLPEKEMRKPVNLPRVDSVSSIERPDRFVLPGEIFQSQMEN